MIDNHDPHQPQKTFSAALRVLRGQMCCRCSSPRPSVSSVDKCVAVAVLRGPPCPPWTKVLRGPPCSVVAVLRGPSWPFVDKCFAVAVLRGPPCRCRSSRPSVFVDKCVAVAVLRGPPCPPWTNVLPLPFFAALRVLRGQMCCRCRSPRPSVSSVDKCVAVAVLRGPPPFVDKCLSVALRAWTNVLPLPFSAVVLRGQMFCRCRSPRPSVSSVDKCVAVAVLRGPPCPPRTNVLPLPFFVARPFVALRGQMFCRCRSPRPSVLDKCVAVAFSAALRVLRGQMFCRCRSSRPSVSSADKCLPLQFSAALRVLRGKRCCRCRSSRPFVALRGQMFCRCSSPRPFVDRPNYDLANLSSENRQRALTI